MIDGEGQVFSSKSDSSFLRFADACELVRNTSSKLKKIDYVAKYLDSLLSDEDLSVATTFLSGKIFPPGSATGEINVGYSLIWKSISNLHRIKFTDLSSYYMKHGDLGSAVEDYLNSKGISIKPSFLFLEPDLSLADVFSAFKELARATGKGSTNKRQQVIERLLLSIQKPVEAKYLLRIMSAEMRIGLVEGLVEESIAKAFSKTLTEIRTANLVTGDIGLVAILARKNRLDQAKLELFRPTNFMLADSAQNASELFLKFKQEVPLISDFKYDGIRAQIHSAESKVKLFSRNLEDITRYFPEIESEVKNLDTNGLILDGEIVPFRDGRPLSFQALQQRLRRLDLTKREVPIRFFAFDLLFLERSVLEEPLSERISKMRALGLGGILTYSEQRAVNSADEIQEMFLESKSLGYEGLVVKSPSSRYTPGRRGRNWVKLKKELDTLDAVIVAAEYGHGKRAGVISDYTFALRDEKTGDLRVIGKAYSGLTDSEITEMTSLLKQITIEDQGYRRIVKPQVILEISFDAVQKSNRHDSGFALRFPRIKRIRADKSLGDIDSLEKVKKIYENQKVKF